ncbi:MAG: type II secretion system F family protein [Alphaproteobacteria bacterium]|nr:type II secretion system F family protein [Alphaproteobacteria bacterium]
MPHYAYRAVDEYGAINKGETAAANENELFAKLHHQGLNLIDCQSSDRPTQFLFNKKVPLPEQVLLCRHLVMLTKAGVPVHTALEDVLPALPSALRRNVAAILQNVTGGASLSSAFASSRMEFDPLVPLLLSAGEKTGKICEALGFLYQSLSWKREFNEKLRRALSYPALQMLLAGTAVAVLMLIAVPQIIQLLEMIGEHLPLASEIILWSMRAFGATIALVMVFAALLAVILPLIKALHQDIALMADRVFLSLPIIGTLFRKVELAQITHVFSAMLGSGVQMMEALAVLPTLTHNRAMAAALQNVAREVSGGQGLSTVLTKEIFIPPYVIRILKIGEDSGKMSESLLHISSVYQQETQQALDQLLRISSLFITLAVGLTLILMVSGVMGPLYRGISHMVAA